MSLFILNALIEGVSGIISIILPTVFFGNEAQIRGSPAEIGALFWGAAILSQAVLSIFAAFCTSPLPL